MNLLEEIEKTETLKNNIKIIKEQINETIVRGGGTTSKSLSEVPDNIKSMITNNYKKIAEGVYSGGFSVKDEQYGETQILEKEFDIPINCEFTPSRFIFKFQFINNTEDGNIPGRNYEPYNLSLDSKYNYSRETGGGMGTIEAYKIFIKEIKSTNVKIAITYLGQANEAGARDYTYLTGPLYWTAIE